MIKIKWLGHACFKIFFDDIQCVIDPFEDNYVPGYENINTSADIILSSHDHNDHNGLMSVRQLLRLVQGVNIKKVETFHDQEQGKLRGKNIVHILEYNGVKIAHFGDIGHILTNQQATEIGDVDVAIVPIGGTYTVDALSATEICRQVNAKIIIPMHYREGKYGFPELDTLDFFEKISKNVEHIMTSEFVVPEKTEKKTIILKYETEK